MAKFKPGDYVYHVKGYTYLISGISGGDYKLKLVEYNNAICIKVEYDSTYQIWLTDMYYQLDHNYINKQQIKEFLNG